MHERLVGTVWRDADDQTVRVPCVWRRDASSGDAVLGSLIRFLAGRADTGAAHYALRQHTQIPVAWNQPILTFGFGWNSSREIPVASKDRFWKEPLSGGWKSFWWLTQKRECGKLMGLRA